MNANSWTSCLFAYFKLPRPLKLIEKRLKPILFERKQLLFFIFILLKNDFFLLAKYIIYKCRVFGRSVVVARYRHIKYGAGQAEGGARTMPRWRAVFAAKNRRRPQSCIKLFLNTRVFVFQGTKYVNKKKNKRERENVSLHYSLYLGDFLSLNRLDLSPLSL